MIDNATDITGWTALLLGLFTVAASIGAFRSPGVWQKMVKEIEASPSLQLVSAFLELVVGTAFYLFNPWVPEDILTCVMKTIGALMVFEALAVLAASDLYFHFWLRNLAHLNRAWVMLSALAGLALTVAALLRF